MAVDNVNETQEFRNKNTWSDDENGMFSAFRSSKDNKNMFKIAFKQMFDNFNVNLRKNKGFLTYIPCHVFLFRNTVNRSHLKTAHWNVEISKCLKASDLI